MQLLRMSYYSLLRMLREPIGLLLLLVLPLVVLSVLGVVLTGKLAGVEGVPRFDKSAVTTIFAVQFFGGNYLMTFVSNDLIKNRKWRMRALPLNMAVYSISHIVACTLFSAIQGLIMVLFTQWVFDVEWGQLGWVLLVLVVFSLLSQFVHLILILVANSMSLAERLSEVLGIGFLVLTGIMFPLPKNEVFHFLSSYGNPVGLGRMAIFGRIEGGNETEASVAVALLLAATLLFAIISVLMGRRKLA